MTQRDAADWLKAHPGWKDKGEVQAGLGISDKATQLSLSKAAANYPNEVESKRQQYKKVWRYKVP